MNFFSQCVRDCCCYACRVDFYERQKNKGSQFLWEAKEQGDEKLLGQKGDRSAVESMFSVKILRLPEDNYRYAYMFRCCVLFWVTIFMNILCCKDCELSTTFCLHRCWYFKKIRCCDNRLIDHLCVLKIFTEFVLIIVFNSDNVVAIWVKICVASFGWCLCLDPTEFVNTYFFCDLRTGRWWS